MLTYVVLGEGMLVLRMMALPSSQEDMKRCSNGSRDREGHLSGQAPPDDHVRRDYIVVTVPFLVQLPGVGGGTENGFWDFDGETRGGGMFVVVFGVPMRCDGDLGMVEGRVEEAAAVVGEDDVGFVEFFSHGIGN
ncbi:hypothetical protein SDJN03_11066, partial [Cucurbita argyrosperma subsp. sororia]